MCTYTYMQEHGISLRKKMGQIRRKLKHNPLIINYWSKFMLADLQSQREVCDYIFQALKIFYIYKDAHVHDLMINSTDDCICFRSTKSSVTDERIANILSYLTYEVWAFTLRSLYERHKILFTLMLAMKIDCHKGLISHDEFSAFIKGESVPAEIQFCRHERKTN